MLRLLSFLLFVLVLLPIGLGRKAFNRSRFSQRFHQAPSAWDRPIATVSHPKRKDSTLCQR